MRRRSGPGELTLVAFALLATGVYAITQGAQTEQDALLLVGVVAFALVVIGVVWPVVALRGLRVEVASVRDATVGDRVPVQLALAGRVSRLEVRTLDPPGEWRRCGAPGRGRLWHVASRRGVFRVVRIEARSGGPLGVFVRRRVLTAILPVPVTVGPCPTRERWDPRVVPAPLAVRSATNTAPPAGDAVRAVRPYVAGDPARLVHWPTSARAGALVVRELEPPVTTGVALAVDLGGADGERTASRAAGLARAALAAGARVLLATCEADGPVCGPVASPVEAGRRLARAVPGRPPDAPAGWPVVVVE